MIKKNFSLVEFLFFPVARVMNSWSPSQTAQQNMAMKKNWSKAATMVQTAWKERKQDQDQLSSSSIGHNSHWSNSFKRKWDLEDF